MPNTTGLCTVEEIYIHTANSCLKSGPGSLDHQAFGCVTVLVCKSNYTLLYCDSEKYAHTHRYLQTAIIFHCVNAARNALKKGTLWFCFTLAVSEIKTMLHGTNAPNWAKNNCSANLLQVQHKKKPLKCFQTAQVHQVYLDIIWQNPLECVFYCTSLLEYSWIRVLMSVNWMPSKLGTSMS